MSRPSTLEGAYGPRSVLGLFGAIAATSLDNGQAGHDARGVVE